MEEGDRFSDTPTSPTPSVTPVISWQTPWSQHPVSQEADETTPSFRRQQESLQREREHFRGQRRLQQQQQQRQASLELLEARSINRALLQQQRQDREEILVLRDENDTLQTELQETRASLERVRREERRLSAALKKQAALLSSETNHRGKAAAAAAAAEKDAGPSKDGRSAGDSSSRTASASVWGDTSSTLSSSGAGSTDGDELDSSRSRTAGTEGSAPACSPKPPLSPLAGTPAGEVGAGQGPELPDLLEAARLSLTGTVSGWLKGMQAACSEGLRQALVLPWLLHKLFYLSTELIDERREELLNIFVGGGAAAAAEGAREEESAYMLRHLRRHYRTVFPLSGANLRAAVHNVMMALAHSMIDSEEWNPSAKDPIAVQSALAASGLEKIVQEYLTIAVLCCLQHPVVTFTDDLGVVDRYCPDRHSEPIDGETAGEWCIVIFPAFVEAGGVPGEERVVGKRFVLNHQKLEGEDA